MFFDDVANVANIASSAETSIFVIPDSIDVRIPQALVLRPEEKASITIEQVRDVLQIVQKKQLSEIFILVRPADVLNLEAANALLKTLEEPQKRVHFVLVTSTPSKLLPTVLSRSAIYFLRESADSIRDINVDTKTLTLAKKLIVAKPHELFDLAEEITKKKDNVRQFALGILGAAIEVLYKTYLINQKAVFLNKLPKFLSAYDAINNNGHIKLHLVADLM